MLSPRKAFAQLKKDGAFVETCDGVHIQWYWHVVGNGYRVMTRCKIDDEHFAPTFYWEFHESDLPIVKKRYF